MKMTKEEFALYLGKRCGGIHRDRFRKAVIFEGGLEGSIVNSLKADNDKQYFLTFINEILTTQTVEVNQAIFQNIADEFQDKLMQNLSKNCAGAFINALDNIDFPTSRTVLKDELIRFFPTINDFCRILRAGSLPIVNKIDLANVESAYLTFVLEIELASLIEKNETFKVLSNAKTGSNILRHWSEYYKMLLTPTPHVSPAVTATCDANNLQAQTFNHSPNLKIKHAKAILNILGSVKIKNDTFDYCIVDPPKKTMCGIQSSSYKLVQEICRSDFYCNNVIKVLSAYVDINICIKKYNCISASQEAKKQDLRSAFEGVVRAFSKLLREGLGYHALSDLNIICKKSANDFSKACPDNPSSSAFRKHLYHEFNDVDGLEGHLQGCVHNFLDIIGDESSEEQMIQIFKSLIMCKIFHESNLFRVRENYNFLLKEIASLDEPVDQTCKVFVQFFEKSKENSHIELLRNFEQLEIAI